MKLLNLTATNTFHSLQPPADQNLERITHLPPLQAGTEVMRVDQMGLASEAMSLAESRRALTEAVKSGRPVWLVVG